MTSVTQSVNVDAPISAVYNQWTQFESFPQFMSGVSRSLRPTIGTPLGDQHRWATA